MSQENSRDEMKPEYDIRGGVRGKYAGRSEVTMPPAAAKDPIAEATEEFARENPDVMEALEVFGIATAEYDRALRALSPSVIYTGSSTQSPR
jgi:hypothetical protein